MANCVNVNSKEFKELKRQTNITEKVLAAKIGVWQDKNGLNKFPSKEDIYSTMAIPHRVGLFKKEISSLEKNLVLDRIRIYNSKNIPIYIDFKKVGEADLFTWELRNNTFYQTKDSQVQYGLKAVEILQSEKAKQIFEKGKKAGWDLNKILTELQIPKEQKQLILDLDVIDREQLALELASKYSFTVEINTAKTREAIDDEYRYYEENLKYYRDSPYDGKEEITKEEFERNNYKKDKNSNYYANLTVPGGTNYTENEIATPVITPSIKGHAQFATDNGIGWFRSDEQTKEGTGRIDEWDDDKNQRTVQNFVGGEASKTRRILEVQSDLFQKGRDKSNIVSENTNKRRLQLEREGYSPNDAFDIAYKEFEKSNENQFLQLLNKNSNWVTFFIKSIIQDSAKKGYEKVLFPSGNTASKVEGHTTLEEFKKQKEDRIKQLENSNTDSKLYIKENNLKENIGNYNSVFKTIQERDKEITQVKQELERVEIEGFGALKPIFNFYENTVTNILNKTYGKDNVKVITDEYGNTWNEITIDPVRESKNILLQQSTVPVTKASKETLEKINKVAEAMGVKITTLQEYAKGNPEIDTNDLNGVADLTQKVIAIAEGQEDVALTEEVIHIATAILEQTNPGVITEMISKIGRFKIYKEVFEKYKNLKAYQNADGTPNIRKIKKEAVDKLLVEVIINGVQESDMNPELREEETISLAKKWWNTILDFISGNYRKTNLDIFKSVGNTILSEDIGSAENITSQGVYAQLSNSNPAVEKLFNTIRDNNKAMKLNTVEEGFEKRHYTYTDATGDVKVIKQSVTEKIEKVFGEPRTGLDKIEDDSKKLWGTRGHEYIMDYILTNLIDVETGFAKEPTDVPIATELHEDIAAVLQQFAKGLIARYKPGTRFLIENKVVNKDKSLGSAIDFMALEPVEHKNGAPGVNVDILDWKFTSIKKEVTDDIPWFKQNDWKAQMNEYARILTEYGANPADIKKARMIPFIMDYSKSIYGPKGTVYANAVEVGDLDNLAETKTYLLPVPITTESTGNPEVDALVSALFIHYDKIKQRKVTTAVQKYAKAERLNALSLAIRKLQVTLNFEPLVGVGYTFIKSAESTIKSLKSIDYSTLSEEELKKHLGDLLSIQNSAKKFINIGNVLLEAYPKGLDEKQRVTLEALGIMSNKAVLLDRQVDELQKLYTMQLGVSSGFIKEANADILLLPEKAISYIAKTFLEPSKLSSNLIKLGTNLLQRAASLVDITFGRQMNTFSSLLIPLEKVAQSKGVDAFSMIGTIDDKGLNLIEKVDAEFLNAIKDARTNKDKQFILDSIDIEAFNKEVEEISKKQEAILKDMEFDSNDAQNNDWILTSRLAKMRNSININRNTFNGWTDSTFIGLVNKHLKKDDNLSKEYLEMAKTPEALAMWQYFTDLNDKAIELGYLNKNQSSFFPLIEATVLQKFSATEQYGKEALDFFKDLGVNRIDESKSYSRLDPETHEVIRKVPTYFTKTDKTPAKLSKDLGRIGALYTKALLDYESRINLENTMLTLYEVEKGKGGLNVDEQGKIIKEGYGYQKNDKTPNAAILKAIIDDSIYGITETSEGVDLSANTKKAIETTNVWTRALGVGLKYKLGIANYFGGNFQAFIMAGGVYKFREFTANNMAITLNKLSLEQRALMDLISPLSESVVTEKLRKFTKEYSYKAYLNTWTFSDVMHATNSFPDRLLQMANAASFNENTMVVDGALVNIREYVRATDRKGREKLSVEQRLALKESQQARIDELKKTKSLLHTVVIGEDGASIPGVSDKELAKYRTRILDYGRNLNGQMSPDNKAAYRRNVILRGFMMFRTWIPKLVHVRVQDVNYNAEQDNWEYGRMRLWGETLLHMGFASVLKMNHIIQNTEEGIKIMDEMLEKKRAKYLEVNGQELQITNEEFYDLVQQELAREIKELRLLFGILGIVLAAKIAEPPEDSTLAEKNRYKNFYKIVSKISDELWFYYDPSTFQEVTKGNIIPSLSLLASTLKVFSAFSKEIYGQATGNQEMVDKAYPVKYFFNIIPGAYQFQTDFLPLIDPEMAKEMGIRVTKTDRRN